MSTTDPTEQIKADVAALQAASAAAADQIAALTDQVLALQAGQVTDDQVANLHSALADVTSELATAVDDSQAAVPGDQPQTATAVDQPQTAAPVDQAAVGEEQTSPLREEPQATTGDLALPADRAQPEAGEERHD